MQITYCDACNAKINSEPYTCDICDYKEFCRRCIKLNEDGDFCSVHYAPYQDKLVAKKYAKKLIQEAGFKLYTNGSFLFDIDDVRSITISEVEPISKDGQIREIKLETGGYIDGHICIPISNNEEAIKQLKDGIIKAIKKKTNKIRKKITETNKMMESLKYDLEVSDLVCKKFKQTMKAQWKRED